MHRERREFRPGTGYLICYGVVLVAVTFGFGYLSFVEDAVAAQDEAAYVPWLFWSWLPIAGALAWQFWRLAIRREPTLVIDGQGFSLDVVFAAVGRIEWSEVESALRLTQRSRDRIQIKTYDPKLPGQRRTWVGRILTWSDGGPGPVEISKAMVDNRLDEVQKLITAYAGTGTMKR